MEYSQLLSSYIEKSKLSLGEIAIKLQAKGIKIDRSYISKLKTGSRPGASEEVTRALAEVTGGDPEALIRAAYIEKAPAEMKDSLREAEKFRFVFNIIRKLIHFVEYYYDHKFVKKQLADDLIQMGQELKDEYGHYFQFTKIEDDPEFALQLIIFLRHHFYPQAPSATMGGETIDFTKYINENGSARRKFPRPELDENTTYQAINQMKDISEAIPAQTAASDGSMSLRESRAYYDGGKGWTEEDKAAADAKIDQLKQRGKAFIQYTDGYKVTLQPDEEKYLETQLKMYRLLKEQENK